MIKDYCITIKRRIQSMAYEDHSPNFETRTIVINGTTLGELDKVIAAILCNEDKKEHRAGDKVAMYSVKKDDVAYAIRTEVNVSELVAEYSSMQDFLERNEDVAKTIGTKAEPSDIEKSN